MNCMELIAPRKKTVGTWRSSNRWFYGVFSKGWQIKKGTGTTKIPEGGEKFWVDFFNKGFVDNEENDLNIKEIDVDMGLTRNFWEKSMPGSFPQLVWWWFVVIGWCGLDKWNGGFRNDSCNGVSSDHVADFDSKRKGVNSAQMIKPNETQKMQG